MVHDIKIEHKHFNDILNLRKRFEIRYNDRDFQVGDTLRLNQLTPTQNKREKATYTGNILTVKVNYILKDFIGLTQGYVAMKIVRLQFIEN